MATQTPDRKRRAVRPRISRLALKRGIHRTREREMAAGEQARRLEGFEHDLPGPMGPPPTAVAIVRARAADASADSAKVS